MTGSHLPQDSLLHMGCVFWLKRQLAHPEYQGDWCETLALWACYWQCILRLQELALRLGSTKSHTFPDMRVVLWDPGFFEGHVPKKGVLFILADVRWLKVSWVPEIARSFFSLTHDGSMGLVPLPKFTIFYHKNQPNVGNIPYMDPMGKQLSVRICLLQRDIPVTCHPRNFPGNRIFIGRKAPITCGEYSSPVRSYMKRQSSNKHPSKPAGWGKYQGAMPKWGGGVGESTKGFWVDT